MCLLQGGYSGPHLGELTLKLRYFIGVFTGGYSELFPGLCRGGGVIAGGLIGFIYLNAQFLDGFLVCAGGGVEVGGEFVDFGAAL